MATATALTINLRIDGLRQTLAAFRDLPKDASASLRQRTLKLAETFADHAKNAARADSPQATLIAPTIKARKDRVRRFRRAVPARSAATVPRRMGCCSGPSSA
jgi:hypothetical protein